DEQQNGYAACARKAAVNGEDGGNPRHGEQHEEQGVHKSAGERDAGPRVKKNNEQNADAQPGINAEIKSRVGKGQGRSGNGSADDSKGGGSLCAERRTKVRGPYPQRHQCFTMALKPAPSRPFFAASADFWSANGPTCTW